MNILKKIIEIQTPKVVPSSDLRGKLKFSSGEIFKQLVIVLLLKDAIENGDITNKQATKLWTEWFFETYPEESSEKRAKKLWEKRRLAIVSSDIQGFLVENNLEIIENNSLSM